MNFFSLDLHIGIRDIQYIFERLGHILDIWSLSDHHSIMGWERAKVDVVNQYNWRNIDQKMCDDFYKRYREEFKKYDAFYVFYPPSFALLYEKFDKPIIMQVPIRYEVPFQNDKGKWEWFNEYLQKKIDEKVIIPLVNNKYDQKYLNLFTKREWNLVPNICDYTDATYTGKKNEYLYCSKLNVLKNFIKIHNIFDKNDFRGMSWQDIFDYKAIIYVPYSNTLMSLFEQYTANIPLLFPTKEFLFQLWKEYKNQGTMSEISWNQINKLQPKSIIGCEGLDPNDYENEDSFLYWSGLSDFYDEENFPYIEYFDSISEIEFMLMSLYFNDISKKIKKFNILRKQKIMDQWKTILKKT